MLDNLFKDQRHKVVVHNGGLRVTSRGMVTEAGREPDLAFFFLFEVHLL